ncbi:rifamycin-inactivating phosphotransferase [Lentzea sp. NPDC051838]|uniref:rifamycin-inactivating phosphotransferase n=1 Tax=Lentzea sp. NPDC051838 TaxID=3154849 RepID=UPI0034359D59
MGSYVLNLTELDQTQIALAGGKGANLGELTRVDGVHVPSGFVVTTEAFSHVVQDVLGELDEASPAEIRKIIEGIAVPDELAAEITAALGSGVYAVRSSATAEDLPGASFAGQQDSYLNVQAADVLRHISLCWASLFTDRAVTYRQRNGFDQQSVTMAVVVQEMVAAEAAGVLFTADPVTSNRKITRVEAVPGLGEAFVSGLVNADSYQVRDGEIIDSAVAASVVTDAQVLELVRLGRRIEAHFGRPQDVEWCLADSGFQIVQSRPITTLFPVPEVDDDANHVYVSVGHQQMMTDAMTPLGLSVWQLTTPRPMAEAGGRLFVDITGVLSVPTSRDAFLDVAGKSDPLIRDALQTVLSRDGFVPSSENGPGLPIPGAAPATIETDASIVTELIRQNEDSVAALKVAIREKTGVELLDFILDDFQELRRLLFDPRSSQVIMAGMQTTWWLNDHLQEWLGEKNAADVLTQSVPHNVTSEMGLALLDVADAIRPHPSKVALLQDAADESFVDSLPELRAYLDKYGMRCVGEIDITRPRWSEQPSTLIPVLLTNIRNFAQGAGAARFEQGRQEALAKEQEVLERLRALPDGDELAAETARMIERVRTFTGYREYPKYGMVSRYFVYKQALLEEAGRLVRAGVLDEREDIYFLRFSELQDVVRTGGASSSLIAQRRDAFRSYQSLTPPRVLTSDGEAISGSYHRDDLPPGAIVGLPVSAGTIEGRARVVLDVADADLSPGDILVTAYTDPSWSPLFVAIAGLVTEVGGVMTHGAVIAREYGLPAVVGVDQATRVIKDGQRIRVHGTDGYIEILD